MTTVTLAGLLLWAAVALLALCAWRAEARRTPTGGHPVWRAAGALACLLWPVALVPLAATACVSAARA